MGHDIELSPESAYAAQDRIEAVASGLRTEQRRLEEQVAGLLGSGWTGSAADAYAEGWVEWRDGASTILSALHTMSQLVGQAASGIVVSDTGARAASTALQQRLGGTA